MTEITDLDRARAEEARRQIAAEDPKHIPRVNDVAIRAAALAREGWEPEDPDLKEAREACARDAEQCGLEKAPTLYRTGERDDSPTMRCALAALKRGRELERGDG